MSRRHDGGFLDRTRRLVALVRGGLDALRGRDARAAARPPAPAPAAPRDPAPVVVYTMDKQRRDVERIVQILDDAQVPYRVLSLEDDPAGQAAVRRDSKGKRLPVVFIAGEVIGGHAELLNLGRDGLRARVLGGP